MSRLARLPLDEAALLAGFAVLVVSLNIAPITNNDVFLHLRTGERVLATGSVPEQDDYSALARGRRYVAHEWLSAVLFRVTETTFGERGLDALILLKTLVALAVAALLYAAARTLGAAPGIAVPSLTLVLVLASARFLERPHIFTYLMLALYLWLLARRRAGHRAPLWAFVPLQVLWANLHGGFVLGPAIVGLSGAGAFFDGLIHPRPPGTPPGAPDWARRKELGEGIRLMALAAALIACCLINPYRERLLAFPFQLTGSGFMQQVYEWLPPFSSSFAKTYMAVMYVVWGAFGIAVLTAALVKGMVQRRLPPGGTASFLVFILLLVLSLRMNRNVTPFALGTFPAVAAMATWLAARRRATGIPARILWMSPALLLLAVWFGVRGYAYSPSSRREVGFGIGRKIAVGGADYLEANDIGGNVLNTYPSGGYLIYRLYPRIRVAMDSRNDVYGEELFAWHRRALGDPEEMRRMIERIDAVAIFIEWTQPGMRNAAWTIDALGGWRPVYFDDNAMVYLHQAGPYSALVDRDAYSVLSPALFLPGELTAETAPRALAEAERALATAGDPYVARVMKCDALAALGRMDEARELEAQLLAERPPLHHIYTYLGILHLRLGDRRTAAERCRAALVLNRRSDAAEQCLREAGGIP